jgi:hypothetical protein
MDDLDRAISRTAADLRKEWASPGLWPRIERALAEEVRAKARPRFRWQPVAAAAAVLAASIIIMRPGASVRRETRTFVSEQALADAERVDEACERSIEELSRLAGLHDRRVGHILVVKRKIGYPRGAIHTSWRLRGRGGRHRCRQYGWLLDLVR